MEGARHMNSRPNNSSAVKHGAKSKPAKLARNLNRVGLAALTNPEDSDATLIDWSRILSTDAKAFGMRVHRLGVALSAQEGITYPGTRALDPLGRQSLIAMAGIIDTAGLRQVYVLKLLAGGKGEEAFRQQHNVGLDIQLAHRLRANVVQAIHDAVPLDAKLLANVAGGKR